MGETLHIPATANREEKYKALLPQIESLIDSESDLIANLANTAAALHETFRFFWVGFYLVKENELVLAPFQGPLACTRIPFGKGVCGTAWVLRQTIVVEDVNLFPGHIACSSFSRSEIVVPIFSQKKVVGILDIDSDQLNDFSDIDKKYLEELAGMIGKRHWK